MGIGDFTRLILVVYIMSSPFVMILLQQNIFKDTFDDELGNRLIIRLQFISIIACITVYFMTLERGQLLLHCSKSLY